MTFTPITAGTSPWDTPLNNALSDLQGQTTAHGAATDPHGDRSWATGQFQPQATASVSQLTGASLFYIAHRGSGGEYPEHTMAAYAGVVAAGAGAIEVSVQCSADGVLFCMHDTTLDRMTNSTWTGSHSTWTWAALQQRAKIVGTPLLGPGWANQDIPTVREVLDRFMGKVVIFLEAKTNAAIAPLQALITSYPGSAKSVVWKGYYTNNSFVWAKAHGYATWAYTDAATTMAQMDAVDANVDYWGVPWEATDAQISATVARPGGKTVIVWEVHRRSEVARLTALGVRGIMCSQYQYATGTAAIDRADAFVTQVKSPGIIGAAHSDPTYALKWDTGAGNNVVYLNATSGNSIPMGRQCPVVAGTNGYKITFDMMFPVLPTGTLHAGIYFAASDDSKHTFGAANAVGCYRMEIRPGTGAMQLYTVAPGATSGVQVGADVTTAAMTAGAWASFEAEVNATNVVLRRTDSTGWSGTFANTAYRGGYFGIHNGSLTDVTTLPRWRNVKSPAL